LEDEVMTVVNRKSNPERFNPRKHGSTYFHDGTGNVGIVRLLDNPDTGEWVSFEEKKLDAPVKDDILE
jgi:hypothetical protein